jgi:thiosulfate/3-mercaptopyruvate sulfurtransferase
MKTTLRFRSFVSGPIVGVLAGLVAGGLLFGASRPATSRPQREAAQAPIPAAAIIEPGELARILQSRNAETPLILQVGIRFLYKVAHIPGAEYIGPGSKDEGLSLLRHRVGPLARSKSIVIYCGCCPWLRCPNVKPAYEALRCMGFRHVKVLRIEENFGTDWVAKGYPTAKGE